MTPVRLCLALLLTLLLVLSVSFPSGRAMAVTLPEGETINKIGYTNSAGGSALRTQPRINSSTFIAYLAQGTQVEVFVKVKGDASGGSTDWYYVRDVMRNRYGYVHASLVTLSTIPINPDPVDPDLDFEGYLDSQGFPASYKPALRQLHAAHPSWVFTAFHVVDEDTKNTGWQPLAFNKALDKEMTPGYNLVTKSAVLSHRSYDAPNYIYATDTWKVYDAGGWIGASRDIVGYSLDPRNFLNEQQIFQFEKLTYHPEVHKIEVVEAAITGSFMAGKTVTFTDLSGASKTMTYAEIFMDAAERTGVNPFFLVQRCLTEVGKNGSDSVSGTVSGYEGYYNFYNIGATAGSSPILNGLRYARYGSTGSGPTQNEKTKYLLPWDSPWRAIVGGAFWIGEGYIIPGQDTSYLQKFNIDGATYGTYWHQYMGNVYAPTIEASRVYNMYKNEGVLDAPFVFRIPVMASMPQSAYPYPSDNLSRNNWLQSLTVSAGTLSPAFNAEKYAYSLTVPAGTDKLTITAQAFHPKATIKNAGTVSLNTGVNTIAVEAISENGLKRVYTLTVTRPGGGTTTPTTTPPATSTSTSTTTPATTSGPAVGAGDSYLIKGDFLINACPAEGRNKAGKILSALTLPSGYTAKISDSSGAAATADTLLGTGSKIEIFYESAQNAERTLLLVIYGDANGDGKINSIDLSYIIDSMYKGHSWTAAQNAALDASRDGKVNSIDLSVLIDHMYKGQTIKQN